MSKRRNKPRFNGPESGLIRSLDNLQLYDTLMPAIRECFIAGGGADQILKKSETLAAMQLIESLRSEKDDVKLKASVEILNRSLGKPVERTLNIYGDISKMNERDIDAQILRAIEKTGADKLIEAVITNERPVKIKQSRKPRKADPIGQDEPKDQA